MQDADERAVAVLTTRTPGTWGNNIKIQVDRAEDPARVEEETPADPDQLNYGFISPSRENRIRITRGATRRS